DSLRKVDIAQPLEHLLPREICVDRIVESYGNERQPELGVREKTHGMRNTAETDFDWNRNLLFNFFRGSSRKEGDHLHLRIGHIGKCLDRQCAECRDARRDKKADQQDEKERLVEGE